MPYYDYNGNLREYKHEKDARKEQEKVARRKRHLEHGKKFNSMPLKEWCRIEREICYKRGLRYWVNEGLSEFRYLFSTHGHVWGITLALEQCKRFNRTWIKRGLKSAFGGENGPGRLITYMEGNPEQRKQMDRVFHDLCKIQWGMINEAMGKIRIVPRENEKK